MSAMPNIVPISELRRLTRELRQLRAVCRAPGTAAECRILNNTESSYFSFAFAILTSII